MRVTVNTDSIEFHDDGLATGIIYLSVGEKSFPESSWNDFVVPVLWWWLQAAGDLIDSASTQSLRFMDGPFEATCQSAKNSDMLQVSFRRNGKEEWSAAGSLDEFTESLTQAIATVVQAAEAQGWNSGDLQNMKLALEEVS